MNTYRTTFYASCPVNGKQIEYHLTIRTRDVIRVERILEALPKEGFHEAFADEFAKLGGHQTLVAEHHGVQITTERSC